MNKDKLYNLLKNFKEENWNKSQFTEFLSESVKMGEVDELDFKKDWIENEKICKLILAIANNGGGVIVIGVEESEDKYIPSGLKCFEDKARLSNNLERFIPGNLIAKTRIENFEFEKEVYGQLHDKKFQCIVIEVDNKDLPYLSIKDGNNIRKNRIYTRRNTSVVDANNTEINQILERRIATMYSHSKNLDFEVHLGQLKILYNNIKKSKVHRVGGLNEQLAKSIKSSLAGVIGHEENVRNPKYPELDFEDFISECISEKQKRIKKELDIN